MPLFLGAVIGLSFLVLMVVFRSVLVPLKAAALNVLGVGAAYGVIVAVFQWGWGANLIGVHETVPIMPLAPMLMFAILFGLSMDYEVFLMSRVREQYLKHRNPQRAVVEGVGSTARVITSAALIMISVFASFILDVDVTTKMFGVGLAVAVLLDVTLVRMVLVPGGDEPARPPRLVAADLARPSAADDRHRGWLARRRGAARRCESPPSRSGWPPWSDQRQEQHGAAGPPGRPQRCVARWLRILGTSPSV